MASVSGVPREGVIYDEKTGEYYLPATQRPDGSWRKPRKVKDGYVPQEEVPTYENKGVTWLKSKPSLPPGLNPDEVSKPKQENVIDGMSKSAKKNAKRKERKKQHAVENITHGVFEMKVGENTNSVESTASVIQSEDPCQMDKTSIEKKLRNLQKKLKQIEQLEEKISSGEVANPEKEQLEKVKKKSNILSEIEDLQLDLASL